MIVEEDGVVWGEEGDEMSGDGEFAGAGERVDVDKRWARGRWWSGIECGHGAIVDEGWRAEE